MTPFRNVLGFSCLLLSSTAALTACGSFADGTPSSGGPGGTASAAPGTDPGQVHGQPGDGAKLSVDPARQWVVQGRSIAVPLKLDRGPSSGGAYRVTVKNLPLDATAEPLEIPAGATSGTLTVLAAPTTPQGAFDLALEAAASGPDGNDKATASLPIFVRGAPGALDTTFGKNGFVGPLFGTFGMATAAHIFDDGSLLATGYDTAFSLVKLTPDGAHDAKFGAGGVASVGGGIFDVLPDGTTYVVAYDQVESRPKMFRYTASGALDTTYGASTPGSVQIEVGLGQATPEQVLGLSDGSALVLAKYSNMDGGPGYAVSRWRANGELETRYTNNAGDVGFCRVSTAGSGGTQLNRAKMMLHADESVSVVVGAVSGATRMISVKICLPEGGPQTKIGSAPNWLAPVTPGALIDVVPLNDSFYLAFQLGGSVDYAHVYVDGRLDKSIGTGGIVTSFAGMGTSIALQADGKVLVGGASGTPQSNITIARHGADGTPDATFGASGLTVTTFGADPTTSQSDLRALHVAPDDRILAVGSRMDVTDGLAARYWR